MRLAEWWAVQHEVDLRLNQPGARDLDDEIARAECHLDGTSCCCTVAPGLECPVHPERDRIELAHLWEPSAAIVDRR